MADSEAEQEFHSSDCMHHGTTKSMIIVLHSSTKGVFFSVFFFSSIGFSDVGDGYRVEDPDHASSSHIPSG